MQGSSKREVYSNGHCGQKAERLCENQLALLWYKASGRRRILRCLEAPAAHLSKDTIDQLWGSPREGNFCSHKGPSVLLLLFLVVPACVGRQFL